MVVSMSPKQKVYHGVLQEIRNYIDSNNLKAGDKLPSERELSEKLGAGRSSVREALRAMELIGLIETRHGEGTFLSQYRPFQTVELLSSFILKGNTTRLELLIVKKLLEKEAAKLAYSQVAVVNIEQLEQIMANPNSSIKEKHAAFFSFIFELTGNLLFSRIWGLVNEYANNFTDHYSFEFYERLITSYKDKQYSTIEDLFNEEELLDNV
ncbi:FadR/GntR family transcriptional regulator [Ornithinibacillus xuwenensis]|uniref:GntR family transcriptional regulator n=1 Tax=Ornithinibacillus xuwenensis TaxID=3144668 RepID=A0ABU9XBE2_9BACI